MPTRVAVCQVPDLLGDTEASLQWMEKLCHEAEEMHAQLICFPECFLQGYHPEKEFVELHALNLLSIQFDQIRKRLASYTPTVVFGLIEEESGFYYNTAVVIKNGELIGKYRKANLLEGESVFTPGSEYPVFRSGDLEFGINICYDTQFPEATARLADQGARLILCVSNTMMRQKNAVKFKHRHIPMRTERVREKKIWMLSSDVTGERNGRIAYGSTSAINPEGEIVDQVPFLATGMISVVI